MNIKRSISVVGAKLLKINKPHKLVDYIGAIKYRTFKSFGYMFVSPDECYYFNFLTSLLFLSLFDFPLQYVEYQMKMSYV